MNNELAGKLRLLPLIKSAAVYVLVLEDYVHFRQLIV